MRVGELLSSFHLFTGVTLEREPGIPYDSCAEAPRYHVDGPALGSRGVGQAVYGELVTLAWNHVATIDGVQLQKASQS